MASLADRFRELSRNQKTAAGVGAGVVVGLLVLVLVLVVGGGDDETAETTTSSSGPTTTTTAPPPAPLTGVPTADESVFSRPAVSVKIGNNPEARPQQGLNEADIVFEEEVEGRITRFLAVFHSTIPERVGPVRSVRLMDSLIARPLGGIFMYSGGANVPERIQRLDEAGLRHFNESQAAAVDATVLDRNHGNGQRPNILFVQPGQLIEASGLEEPPPPFLTYRGETAETTTTSSGGSTTAPAGAPAGEPVGEEVPGVFVPVGQAGYNPVWLWDPAEEVWKRFLNGEPYQTKSGDQVAFENLIVQFVERQGEESLVVGSGRAVFLTDGRMIEGNWSREDPDAPTEYLDSTGQPVEFTPGRTWVMLPLVGTGEVRVVEDAG